MNEHPDAQVTATPSQHVLVVCAANVCRSASVEAMLGPALRAAQPQVDWRIESAGTSARPDQHMCSSAARYVRRVPGGEAFAAAHRSAPLSLAAVERAGLVLVASTAERAAVATLSPAARRRLFTVREAGLLIGRLADRSDAGMPLATDGSQLLATVVDLLHEQRGTLAISAGPAHFTSRRRGDRRPTVDLGDVHQGQERRHKPVLEAASEAVETLARGIGRVQVLPTLAGTDTHAARHADENDRLRG